METQLDNSKTVNEVNVDKPKKRARLECVGQTNTELEPNTAAVLSDVNSIITEQFAQLQQNITEEHDRFRQMVKDIQVLQKELELKVAAQIALKNVVLQKVASMIPGAHCKCTCSSCPDLHCNTGRNCLNCNPTDASRLGWEIYEELRRLLP